MVPVKRKPIFRVETMARILIRSLAVLAILAGCARSGPLPDENKTVHYYQFSLPRDREAFDRLRTWFHEEHPEVNLQIHTLPTSSDDQHQFYLTHLGSRSLSRIDVFALDVIWLAEFARAGFLMPLDDLFPEREWEEFFPAPVQAATYDRHRYAAPLFVDAGVLYSRKDLLLKHGFAHPPKTWEELVKASRVILEREEDPSLNGFVWQGKQYEGLVCNLIEFLPSRNPFLTVAESPRLEVDRVRRALGFMRDLVVRFGVSPPSVFSMSEEESRQVFQNGRAVFMRNWPYAWRLAQQEGSPVKDRVWLSPLPAFAGDASGGKGALGGFLLGIHPESPAREEARAWVRFLASPRAQRVLWQDLGLTPARRTVFPDLPSRGIPLDVLRQVMESAVPRPASPLYIPISQSVQAYGSGALAGVYPIDRAIRHIESDMGRIMRVMH
ncbi:MAG: hypothetical protein COV67_01470 [Nitrospinae bacterium CG11_big_fil_rev_8_21_14_0_20_56_8]|nr:MAG: hypothetical protein COV67_01470 [Nitrospinae bacterium CG11_big_fil_rev_8_21_14_0_20_56_8]